MQLSEYPDFLHIISLAECDSTNNYIKANYEKLKDRLPILVTSALQTAGRGREKRTWVSPPGLGLYSSFGFNLENVQYLNLLPLIAGLGVIRTLETMTTAELGLKWPNDVLCQNKKIAGILIENVITENKVSSITGIGINLNHTTADFPDDLQNKATSLKLAAGIITPVREVNPVLATFFFQWVEKLEKGAHDEIIQAARQYSNFLRDKRISFHQPPHNKILSGIFKDINSDGGLILENDEGSSTIYYTGEII